MSAEPLARWLAEVSPPGTCAAAGPVGPARAFAASEETGVAGARPARRDEFLTGRALARAALAGLGCPPCPIPADAERVPIWPDGFLGSISHGGGLCLAQVARSRDALGLGIDVEPMDAVEAGLIEELVRPDEWAAMSRGAPADADAATLCFSAKEAVYKAYFPRTRAFLEFGDLRLEVDWSSASFAAALVAGEKPSLAGRRRFEGRFARIRAHLATAVWVLR
jgi:4'-phosphopantetheinyl transferase EntD